MMKRRISARNEENSSSESEDENGTHLVRRIQRDDSEPSETRPSSMNVDTPRPSTVSSNPTPLIDDLDTKLPPDPTYFPFVRQTHREIRTSCSLEKIMESLEDKFNEVSFSVINMGEISSDED